MAKAERQHLHLVDPGTGQAYDPETGELAQRCPQCAALEEDLRGVESEKRSWRSRYFALKRDKDAEAQASPVWGWAVALFWEWKIATGHMRSGWTAERFFLCKPYLERDGFQMCRLAVWGVAAHPNTKQVTKDYAEVYDDWELLFRNRGTFERYVNRGWAIFGSKPPQECPALTEQYRDWQQENK